MRIETAFNERNIVEEMNLVISRMDNQLQNLNKELDKILKEYPRYLNKKTSNLAKELRKYKNAT